MEDDDDKEGDESVSDSKSQSDDHTVSHEQRFLLYEVTCLWRTTPNSSTATAMS